MKHVSRFLVAVSAILVTSAVSAGTLYWQVPDEDENIYAQLFVRESSSDTGTGLSGWIQAPTGIQQQDVSAYTTGSYLFYVELWNYSTPDVAPTKGYEWGYTDLVSSGYVSFGATDIPTVNANVAALGSFASAPEPSSGLLLLMGGAMLALRRRRQK